MGLLSQSVMTVMTIIQSVMSGYYPNPWWVFSAFMCRMRKWPYAAACMIGNYHCHLLHCKLYHCMDTYVALQWTIDFSINGLCTSGYKCQNKNGPQHHAKLKLIDKFGDANRVNSSNFIAWRSDFLRKWTIHFRMFFYLVTCFLRVMVSLLCRSQARTISFPFTN